MAAVQHGPTGYDNGGKVTTGCAHHQRRGGFVAAAEQYDAVDRIGSNRLLHIHADEVPIEHRGGADDRLTQ